MRGMNNSASARAAAADRLRVVSKRDRGPSSVPPRGPAVAARSFLVSFDVDCGELVQGHRFVARGLSDVGQLSVSDWTESAADTSVQGFTFEYELVPGVPSDRSDNFFEYLVGVAYEADVELPWEPVDGGALAPFEGGRSTHGSRGDWPLPAGARRLTFTMFGIPHGSTFPNEAASGELVVDLDVGTATWQSS